MTSSTKPYTFLVCFNIMSLATFLSCFGCARCLVMIIIPDRDAQWVVALSSMQTMQILTFKHKDNA